jgi:hypothetical protein
MRSPVEITMQLDADWVYREFLRRGYKQEYAADFLDQAWKNSDIKETRLRTAPDVYPVPEAVRILDEREVKSLAKAAGLARYMWDTDTAIMDLGRFAHMAASYLSSPLPQPERE